MKRREVLWIIRNFLTTANGDDRYCAFRADDDAEACLKALEEAGMLPPPRLDKDSGNILHTWEPENES